MRQQVNKFKETKVTAEPASKSKKCSFLKIVSPGANIEEGEIESIAESTRSTWHRVKAPSDGSRASRNIGDTRCSWRSMLQVSTRNPELKKHDLLGIRRNWAGCASQYRFERRIQRIAREQ